MFLSLQSDFGVWRSPVSVLDWGSRGREFKSRHPDKDSERFCGEPFFKFLKAHPLKRLISGWLAFCICYSAMDIFWKVES